MTEQQWEIMKIREKGEVTIPKPIREYMKLQPGDHVSLETNEQGQICIHKIKPTIIPNNGGSSKNTTDPISPTKNNNPNQGEKDQ